MGLGSTRAMTRGGRLTLFGQTMAFVAATAGLFALGAYAGRNLSESLGWVWFIAAIACLFAMNATARRSTFTTILLLGAFGILIGLATAPLSSFCPRPTRRSSGKQAAPQPFSSPASEPPASSSAAI